MRSFVALALGDERRPGFGRRTLRFHVDALTDTLPSANPPEIAVDAEGWLAFLRTFEYLRVSLVYPVPVFAKSCLPHHGFDATRISVRLRVRIMQLSA